MRTNAVHVRGADRTESAFVRAHVCRAVSWQREPATFATCLHVRSKLSEVFCDIGTSARLRSSIVPTITGAPYMMDQSTQESNQRSSLSCLIRPTKITVRPIRLTLLERSGRSRAEKSERWWARNRHGYDLD